MRFESKAMAVPAAVAAGAAIPVERFTEKSVLFSGVFVATMRVQGSMDGASWADVSGDVTTPQLVEVPHTVRYLRVNTTAYTSGAPAASFGGFDARAI